MKILVTGSAGFIGYHLTDLLINKGLNVIGLDCINEYYDVNLKLDRLKNHGIIASELIINKIKGSTSFNNYSFVKADISDTEFVMDFMKKNKIDHVVHLAAQAGVRYSIENPKKYVDSNLVGFYSILESCRKNNIKHLIYASTSSVYGLNSKMPLSEDQSTQHPVSFYAATKKANEMMAHSYSHLYELPTTGLRFFTVYGPWGRPDMALFLFTKAMLNGERIKLFNYGDMVRDFTYVDDIVNSIFRLISKPAKKSSSWDSKNPNPSNSSGPFSIFNIGNSSPTKLVDFVETLEEKLQLKAKVNLMEIQPGDVSKTFADNNKLFEYIDFIPKTTVKQGISDFVDWYKSYYKI